MINWVNRTVGPIKTYLLLAILAVFIGSPIMSFAAASMPVLYTFNDNVELTDALSGQKDLYKPVNLKMGTSLLNSDMPAILYRIEGYDRTLVPVRVISETLGATVSWHADEQRVRIAYQTKTIDLKLNSAEALVDGNIVPLPNAVPAKLMTFEGVNRTLVPVRFISEQLGVQVTWDNDSRIVVMDQGHTALTGFQLLPSTFSTQNQSGILQFNTSGLVSPTSFMIEPQTAGEAYQLVVDLHNTLAQDLLREDWQAQLKNLNLSKMSISKVEVLQYQSAPNPIARVIVYFDKKMSYSVLADPSGLTLHIGSQIKQIEKSDLALPRGGLSLEIEGLASPQITTEGAVVKVDFIETTIAAQLGSQIAALSKPSWLVEAWIQEYTWGSQLVLTTTDAATAKSLVQTVDSQIDDKITVEIAPALANYSADTKLLSISGLGTGSYQLVAVTPPSLTGSQELKLYVPPQFSASQPRNIVIQDDYIDTIQCFEENGVVVYRILIKPGIEAIDANQGHARGSIDILFSKKMDSQAGTGGTTLPVIPNGPIHVVLDAGHGGLDPGAISKITGVKEKDLDLKLVLMVKEKLEGQGVIVSLTRGTDMYITLKDRVAIANALNAQAFVSIHANTSDVASAVGIETLYAKDARNSQYLGSRIQAAMVSATQAKDRGVLARNELVVVRETTMPAVLLEVGFLSNANEALLLQDQEYLDKIVGGIVQGLLNYFKP